MTIVTGATGALNGSTVEHLLKHVAAADIGVSMRDPRRVQHLANLGVLVRRGSYEDPVARGTTEFVARMLLTTFEAARQGRFAGVDPALNRLLGREPCSVTELLTERVSAS